MTSIKQIDGYKILMTKLIGEGSFGRVYQGINDKTSQKVAVKILPKQIDADQYLKNALFSEIKIMQCVKSTNVVGFYDVMESSKNYYLVQQLCDGDLGSIMKSGQVVEQNKAKEYLRQICNGFLALVKEGIIHRDLKPANIMIRGDNLKIGDFGFAKKSETSNKVAHQTIVGTPLYMSLQILKSQPYSSKCDIWALGFIYYQMLHGYPPWNGKSQYDLINKIQSRPLKLCQSLTPQSKDFLRKCLQIRQSQRISWDQLFLHQIFKGYFQQSNPNNKQFQNKLKTIMSSLRFKINSNNIDLGLILTSMGYCDGNSLLDKKSFFQFLGFIDKEVLRNQAEYIFQKVDINSDGKVSINQIQNFFIQNKISLSTINRPVPGAFKKQFGTQSFQIINPQTQKKIKTCFSKLMKNITMYGSSLKNVYESFDVQKKGKMNYDCFCKMISSIGQDITKDQMKAAFDIIDTDGSKTIQFGELETYYTKVNGVVPNQKKIQSNNYIMDEEKRSTHQGQYNQQQQYPPQQNYYNQGYGYGQNYNPYQPPVNQGQTFNPFNALLQPPMPPQYYPYNQPPYNPYMYPQGPQGPQQGQGGGLFDQFVGRGQGQQGFGFGNGFK